MPLLATHSALCASCVALCQKHSHTQWLMSAQHELCAMQHIATTSNIYLQLDLDLVFI